MALPAQVKKQIREGNKAHAAAYGDNQEAAEAKPVEPETPPEAQPEETPPETPEPVGKAEGEETSSTSVEPTVREPAPEVDYEQRFKVLQGKYNSEVPQLHQQLRETNARLQQLQEKLEAQPEPAEAPAQAPQPNGHAEPLVTDAEREEYGADLINLIEKVTRQTVGSRVEQLDSVVGQIKDTVQTVSGRQEKSDEQHRQDAYNTMMNRLQSEIPDWQLTNGDPAFLGWLSVTDPFSGVARQQLLTAAFEANDADRVIRFFRSFLNENTATSAPSPAPAATPQPRPAVQMEDLAAPRTGGGVGGGSTKEQRHWKRADIKRFYDEVSAGKFRNNEAERQRLERDIISAQREGRIVDPPQPSF